MAKLYISNKRKFVRFLLITYSILFVTVVTVSVVAAFKSDDKENQVNAALGGCHYTGTAACNPTIFDNPGAVAAAVEQSARNNPGTQYMAWCTSVGNVDIVADGRLNSCQCPQLNPAPGVYLPDACGACGNPTGKFTPGGNPPPPPPPPPPPYDCTSANVQLNWDYGGQTYTNAHLNNAIPEIPYNVDENIRFWGGDCGNPTQGSWAIGLFTDYPGATLPPVHALENTKAGIVSTYDPDIPVNDTYYIGCYETTDASTAAPRGTNYCGAVLIRRNDVTPICGNGIVEAGEQCDDGNTNNNDACSNACTINQPTDPSFSISKTLSNGAEIGTFEVGDTITFNVTILNDGDTDFTSVEFRDVFDPVFLNYTSGNVTIAGEGTFTINNVNFDVTETINQIAIEDLLDPFNDPFQVGEEIEISLSFMAISPTGPNGTINTAFADVPGLPEESDTAVVIIEESEEPVANATIDKNVRGVHGPYSVGDTILFDIRIENTGEITFTDMSFTDQFDPTYLQINLANSSARNGDNSIVINNLSTVATANQATGIVTIPNLAAASVFGPIEPGDVIIITLNFTALAEGQTVNTAIIDSTQLDNPREDEDDVFIDEDVEIVGCDAVCDATHLCNGNLGLFCATTATGNRCRLQSNPSSATCQPADEEDNPVLDIDKILSNDQNNDHTYLVGEEVIFTIRIENKGDTTFDVVEFEDFFDPEFLQVNLADSYIGKSTGGRLDDLTGIATNNNGYVRIADITNTFLGNLAPGQFYDVVMYFTALQETDTEPNGMTNNFAVATADGLTDDDGEDVIIVDDNDIEIAECNELCGGTTVCDASQGLVCVNLGGESRCRLATNISSVTCEQEQEDEPELTIDKRTMPAPDGAYNVGDIVRFEIDITNVGSVVVDNVRFTDTYNPAMLQFIGGDVSRYNASGVELSRVSNISSIININSNGFIEITDLTTSLGNLNPGDFFRVRLQFRAMLPGTTTNVAVSQTNEPDGDVETDQDSSSVTIFNLDTDI